MTTRNPSINPRSDPAAPPMATIQQFNIVGTFPNRTDAQAAFEQLKTRGFGIDDAKLLGETEDLQPTRYGLTEEDRKVAGGVMRSTPLYAVGGAVLLGVIGVVAVLLGSINNALGYSLSGGLVLAGLLVGALIGLIIGGLVGSIAGLDRGKTGHDAYGDQVSNGPAAVGIKAVTPDDKQRARATLTDLGATDVAEVVPIQRGDG